MKEKDLVDPGLRRERGDDVLVVSLVQGLVSFLGAQAGFGEPERFPRDAFAFHERPKRRFEESVAIQVKDSVPPRVR